MKTALRVAGKTLLFSAMPLLALAAPVPVPSPAPAREGKSGPLPLRSTVDSLSDADIQQVLDLLRSNFVRSTTLDEATLNRATLQGLLERLGSGAALWSAGAEPASDSPFRSEILDERIGYVRLGSLNKDHLAEFDAALGNFGAKKVPSLVLDLRATPQSTDFELAAEIVKRLTPKGKMLFALHRPSVKQERMFTSDRDPVFQGTVVTLVSRESAGASEVIAAVLRTSGNALVIGQKTSGQAAEFVAMPLRGGKLLRVAVAEVKLPQNLAVFPEGLKPDLPVEVSSQDQDEALRIGLEKGVGGLVYETERAHLNEAALVAGTNPEIDAEEAAQRDGENGGAEGKKQPFDVVLQRAVDLVTTLRVFGSKAP